MRTNPYSSLPDESFWRRAVARPRAEDVDPVSPPPFKILPKDPVATAGSCFAQYLSRTLQGNGYNYLITEEGPSESNYGVFPARFGNIYSARQLLQLFNRAYGLFEPRDDAWVRQNGVLIDPFRPEIEKDGFPSLDSLLDDRRRHFRAVRCMFEDCSVFIFTLGLTECWRSTEDGAVFPVAPGVAGGPKTDSSTYEFYNLSVAEMVDDLTQFINAMRTVNPEVKIILTVSPVPLVATYERRHVLTSTTLSKSALRVVADMISRQFENVTYFPSYEIITGPQARYKFFEKDLRTVTSEGVAHVMELFRRHYFAQSVSETSPGAAKSFALDDEDQTSELSELQAVVCEEELLDE